MTTTDGPAQGLSVLRVAAGDRPTRHFVMLHGIYGRGRNWLGIARTLTAAHPDWVCWLVDLPHHGASGPGRHGDTVTGLAADVQDWLTAQGISPDVVLGHSYGGKVALAMAAAQPQARLQVWVIDSTPEVKAPSGTSWTMMNTVRRLPARFASREQAQQALVSAGYELGVAQWMTTNLRRDGDGLIWQLDFGVMERLLRDFFVTDMWPVIEQPAAGHDVHMLKATRSGTISGEAVRRIEAATATGRVHLHHLDGGHWIQADRPDLVAALLDRHLPA